VFAAAQRRAGAARLASQTPTRRAAAVPPPLPVVPELPALVLSPDRPDLAVFFGQEVALRPAEFRLLRMLAEKPGKCVSYDALYDRMWGETLAEPGQIYAHRSRLCLRLGRAVPDRDPKQIVMTIPRRGLMLNLAPQEVMVS